MIGFLIITLFIISSLIIFLFNYYFAIIGLFISLVIFIIKKISIKKIINQLKIIAVFVIIVFACNLIFDTFISSIIISLKIISVCLLSFSLTTLLNKKQIAHSITIMLYPLKLFKVDLSKIELMLIIALNYINILKNDFLDLKKALMSKGMNFGIKHFIKSYLILMKKYFENLFLKINELETSLYSKGWID